jgi:predicted metal-binding membrane protein
MANEGPLAMNVTILERVMRHDRLVVIAGLSLLILLSWSYLLLNADVGTDDMAGMAMSMGLVPWTLERWAVMLLMWLVMMVAMMLPGAAPMILLYTRIARGHDPQNKPAVGTGFFTLGYIAIWSGYSVAAVALQFWLDHLALLSPMMKTTSITVAGSVLVMAGLYQWTPLKHACLKRCRSPLEFVLSHWRTGANGAFIMGIQHGLYCVGCCWVIMLLLFFGGVMNPYCIAGIAAFVLVEKLFPGGPWFSRVAGTLLMAWGVGVLMAL